MFMSESEACYCYVLNLCIVEILSSEYCLFCFLGVLGAMKLRAVGLLCMTARQLACSFVLIGWRSLIR